MNEPTPQPRNLRFDFDDRIPRHWLGGRRSVTTFLDNLSVFFPPGERFFIEAVRAHRDHATAEPLASQVHAFIAQEGFHSREHVRYNAMLERRGYPAEAMERRVEALLRRVRRRSTRRFQLAVTCALEHFTSLMAYPLLADERELSGADPTMAALWRWHAAEESEHKAVAFDVYKAAGGPYSERALAMIAATVVFWAKVIEHQAIMMRVDGTSRSPREWAALAWFLFVNPGGMRRVLRLYFAYFRPGFHPNDLDSTEVFESWLRAQAAGGASRPQAA